MYVALQSELVAGVCCQLSAATSGLSGSALPVHATAGDSWQPECSYMLEVEDMGRSVGEVFVLLQ